MNLNACAEKAQLSEAFQKNPNLFPSSISYYGNNPHIDLTHKKDIVQHLNIKSI